MIQSCSRGIGGAKTAWLHYNRFHVASSCSSYGHSFPRPSRSQGAAVIYGLELYSVNVSGRAHLSGFCHTFRRVSRNDGFKIVGTRRKGFAIKVKSEYPGLNNGAVEEAEEEGQEDFLTTELLGNKMEIEDDDSEPLTLNLKPPGERDGWWRIPDFIHEVLPLPKNFNPQLEILYNKLGCRIHSRELLLRILVHKSYYLSKMPQSIRERTLRKPLMSWQRAETTGDDSLMTFAEAHGEARLQLALLGDTVLNLAASLYLIRQHPLLSTGLITERRSQLVCNSNLAHIWSTLLDLRELVLCDPPLSQSRRPSATTVLELQMKACADTLEAYVGGLYVEKGLESALQCVETRLLPLLLLAEPTRNPVALLHEQCAILLQEKPDYKLIGIDNKNTPNESCRIRVYVKGMRLSTGTGKSKKLARRDAAEKALIKWPELFGSTS